MERRTIGRRLVPEIGRLAAPSPEEQAWLAGFSHHRTRVPKGVFRYRTHREANADWERWNAELVAETVEKG